MKFPVVKILDFKSKIEELKTSSNPFATIILCQLAAIEAKGNETRKLANKKDMITMLYNKGFDRTMVLDIMRFLDGILVMSRPSALEYTRYVDEMEKEKKMSYLTCFEEFAMEKGIEIGREQGHQQGQKEGERLILQHLLETKFLKVSECYQKIMNEAEPGRLLLWAERILYCKTIEEIFED